MTRLKKQDKPIDDFDIQERVYTDAELEEFHKALQRFYSDKTLSTGEEVRVLNFDEFAVAFGARVKLKNGIHEYYAIPHKTMVKGVEMDGSKRNEEMLNLLKQHDAWVRKTNWVDQKELVTF